jgi:hypothetical protein
MKNEPLCYVANPVTVTCLLHGFEGPLCLAKIAVVTGLRAFWGYNLAAKKRLKNHESACDKTAG